MDHNFKIERTETEPKYYEYQKISKIIKIHRTYKKVSDNILNIGNISRKYMKNIGMYPKLQNRKNHPN